MPDRTPYTPRCTYRLQLKPGFGFREAAEIAPYLEATGNEPCVLLILSAGGARE